MSESKVLAPPLEETDARLLAVWNQSSIPVILRRGEKGQKLRVRLPYGQDNRQWLRNGRRAPTWDPVGRWWETPKAWFNDLVERSLTKYQQLYIIQPFREQEKCAPACMNAMGHECQCSCMGANHGVGNDGSWFEVSDIFATRWGESHLACRLMSRPEPPAFTAPPEATKDADLTGVPMKRVSKREMKRIRFTENLVQYVNTLALEMRKKIK